MEARIFTIVIRVVFCSSVASLLLPPIETFKDFPRFQKFYGVLVTIVVRWAALNLRNTLYSKYFDTNKLPTQPPPNSN